jgi:hypothetical protein
MSWFRKKAIAPPSLEPIRRPQAIEDIATAFRAGAIMDFGKLYTESSSFWKIEVLVNARAVRAVLWLDGNRLENHEIYYDGKPYLVNEHAAYISDTARARAQEMFTERVTADALPKGTNEPR